jgi:hypothetical protein
MTGLPPIRSGSEYYGTDYMGSHIIVWDLETVPDLTGFAAANDLVGKSDVEIREEVPKTHLPLNRLHRRPHRTPGAGSLGGGRRRRATRGREDREGADHRLLRQAKEALYRESSHCFEGCGLQFS